MVILLDGNTLLGLNCLQWNAYKTHQFHGGGVRHNLLRLQVSIPLSWERCPILKENWGVWHTSHDESYLM
jgi:hypothetical protein